MMKNSWHSIIGGSASSNGHVFKASELHKYFESGFMQYDLNNDFVLFGDNAYLNTAFMATQSMDPD